jgi:hypothetical protein
MPQHIIDPMARLGCGIAPVVRFWSFVDVSDGCWEWTDGYKQKGYGRFTGTGVSVLAHRFSWELHRGPIPNGLYVCHKCDNPSCVRPDHLFLGTAADNVADMISKGRHKKPPATHCKRGHPFDDTNTIIRKTGTRLCRTCTLASTNERRYRYGIRIKGRGPGGRMFPRN